MYIYFIPRIYICIYNIPYILLYTYIIISHKTQPSPTIYIWRRGGDYRLDRFGSWLTGKDYPNDTIAENGQNPDTSPGDFRRIAVTQTPEKNHQQTLM